MSNPVLSEKQWGDISDREGGLADANAMTVNGTIMKTGLLLVVMLMSMWWMFDRFWGPAMMQSQIMPFMIGGAIGGLVLCLAMMFAKKLAMFLGCGVVAFAIGCSDGGNSTPPTAPTAPAIDPSKMKEMQMGGGELKPGDERAILAATRR